jgi:hypothetical protein
MMEASSTFEKSVNFYQATRRCNPEDSHLHDFELMAAFWDFAPCSLVETDRRFSVDE